MGGPAGNERRWVTAAGKSENEANSMGHGTTRKGTTMGTTTTAQTRHQGQQQEGQEPDKKTTGMRTTTTRGAGTTGRMKRRNDKGATGTRTMRPDEYRYDGQPAPLALPASHPPPPARVVEGLLGKQAPAPGQWNTGVSRTAIQATTTMEATNNDEGPSTMVGGCGRQRGSANNGGYEQQQGHHVQFCLPFACSHFPSTRTPAPIFVPFLVVSLY